MDYQSQFRCDEMRRIAKKRCSLGAPSKRVEKLMEREGPMPELRALPYSMGEE